MVLSLGTLGSIISVQKMLFVKIVEIIWYLILLVTLF